MFIFRKVFFQLRRHKISYTFFVIELAVGMAFLVYAMNSFVSFRDRKSQFESTGSDQAFVLNIYHKDNQAGATTDESPFTTEDYQYLSELMDRDVEVILTLNQLASARKEVIDYNLIFTNLISGNKDEIYIQDHLFNRFSQNTVFYDMRLNVLEQEISYKGKVYHLKDMKGKLKQTSLARINGKTDIRLEDSILFPMEAYSDDIKLSSMQVYIRVIPTGKEKIEEMLDSIETYFNNLHPTYRYAFTNYLDDYEVFSKNQVELMKYIGVIAVIILGIMTLGFIGIMRQFFRKREKSLAVSMAVGATKEQLLVEVILEVLFVCIVGGGIGSLIGVMLSYKVEAGVFEITHHSETCVVAMICIFLCAIFISYQTIYRLFHLQPQRLLRDL